MTICLARIVLKGCNFFNNFFHVVGDVLVDIIETFKEIENMKLELTKLFINEVIIPLESRAEIQIGNMKVGNSLIHHSS